LKLLPPRKKSNWKVILDLPMKWWTCDNCYGTFDYSLFVDYETSGLYSFNPRAVSLYSLHDGQEECLIYEIVYKEIVTEKLEGNKIRTFENELLTL